jgi:integrase
MLSKHLGPDTINLTRATLSGALNQAVKWNLLARNPVSLVEPPYDEDNEPQPFTPEQAAAFLQSVAGHEFAQLYTAMLATGLRIGSTRPTVVCC